MSNSVPTVAYLANQFPAAVEPYVGEEIQELRRRGVTVIPGSVRRPDAANTSSTNQSWESAVLCLQPVQVLTLLRALGLIVTQWERISTLMARVLLQGQESLTLRLKALLHTGLGACYAVLLRDRGVDHIHVHHGYFGSWIAMVAARLLGIDFSMTLHGSDLLLHGVYLDTKLKNCQSCVTISEYNRRYILDHFPEVDPGKIIVSRLGVNPPPETFLRKLDSGPARNFTLLAVGRLHAVKDHAFLVRACARLRELGLDFQCAIAGEGPERRPLELLIQKNRLQDRLRLLGHMEPRELDALYRDADLVVLTSRSEGIPLVLMEAMARGKIVLAPAITGISELVIPGKTGFLYQPGDHEDFIRRILFIQSLMQCKVRPPTNRLNWVRHAARVQVFHNFNREKNRCRFADTFLRRIKTHAWSSPYADPILQQI
jgi:colanic acid/amylovoran biosynthesis glycosyltransferase